jgi:hypothetical protein
MHFWTAILMLNDPKEGKETEKIIQVPENAEVPSLHMV